MAEHQTTRKPHRHSCLSVLCNEKASERARERKESYASKNQYQLLSAHFALNGIFTNARSTQLFYSFSLLPFAPHTHHIHHPRHHLHLSILSIALLQIHSFTLTLYTCHSFISSRFSFSFWDIVWMMQASERASTLMLMLIRCIFLGVHIHSLLRSAAAFLRHKRRNVCRWRRFVRFQKLNSNNITSKPTCRTNQKDEQDAKAM